MPAEPKRVPVALIGAGRVGRMHGEILRRRVDAIDLRVVVEPALDRAWATRLEIERWCADPAEVWEDPSIEAVVIATPTDTHVGLVEQAAAAGKHVFCEKPVASEPGPILRAVAAAERAGVVFQVGFNRRFDPSYRDVHEAVRGGEVGRVHTVLVQNRDGKRPDAAFLARSGGMLVDMSIHDFDVLRWVSGSEPVEVFAYGATLFDGATDTDTAAVSVRLDSGALGVILSCREAAFGHDQRLEVVGAQGCVASANPRQLLTTRIDGAGARSAPIAQHFSERFAQAYVEQFRSFAEVVRGGGAPAAGGRDAVVAITTALAAQESLRTGGPVPVRPPA